MPLQEDLDFLSDYQAVHIGQSSGLDPWVAAASSKTLLSYDFSTRREPGHRRAIAPHCHLASVSGDGFTDAELNAIACELLELGSRWVLVTRGRAGTVLRNASDSIYTPARLVQPVDTLGAGDTLIARTLFGLLKGEAPADVMGHAAEAAAVTFLYYGGVGYPAAIEIGGRPRR